MMSGGYAGILYEYINPDGGDAVNYTGARVEILTYLEEDGNPLRGWSRSGYCKLRKTYNDANRIIKEEYLNADGEPSMNRACVFGKAYEYDEYGRLICDYTFGRDGKPNSGRGKVAMTKYSYDETGKRTAIRCNAKGERSGW